MIKDVHTEHCCVRHGCKYMWTSTSFCTVVSGMKIQSGMCETCSDELEDGDLEIAYLMNEMFDRGRQSGMW